MAGFLLNFSKYAHVPDKFFPHGEMFLKEDERGRFVSVETKFVVDGIPEGVKELSFYDRSPTTLAQFAVLRTYCEMAKESAKEVARERLNNPAPVGAPVPLYPLQHQVSSAEFGIEILNTAIKRTFISDWSAI